MTDFVIDASVAIKWVVEESETAEAIALRHGNKFLAPNLLVAESANVLWKKVHRGEISSDEALLASRLLGAAGIEFVPEHTLFETVTRIALEIGHPAYDCVYMALAASRSISFVTADQRLFNKLSEPRHAQFRARILPLTDSDNA